MAYLTRGEELKMLIYLNTEWLMIGEMARLWITYIFLCSVESINFKAFLKIFLSAFFVI